MARIGLRVALGAILILALLSIYGLIEVRGELAGLRRTLSSGAADLDREDLLEARGDLEALLAKLDGPVYSVLKVIPVARQNVMAATDIAESALPMVDTALESADLLDREDDFLFRNGVVQLDAIGEVADVMSRQAKTVEDLTRTARSHLSGWLIPSAWEDVSSVVDAGQSLAGGVQRLAEGARLAPALLGTEEPRRFAVVLLNNAEARGAGGVATAIGSITFDQGRLDVGSFRYYRDLSGAPPYETVQAPADFSRRFGRYGADTTEWINVSVSPDVPDVGAVVDRLMKATADEPVSGVIVVDPRGLASFLDDEDDIDSEELDIELLARRVPRFVYSDAYEKYANPTERRDALLSLAPSILEEVTEELDLGTLRRVAEAAAGGHLAIYSERADEQQLFTQAAIAGSLVPTTDDHILVTMQNLGADKLDYWLSRRQRHRCDVTAQSATCQGWVDISNEAPPGLPRYVTQGDREYEGYLELYVPEAAEVTGLWLDDEVPDLAIEEEDGRRSLGLDVRIPPGAEIELVYTYELPHDGAYSLELRPQPLTSDAQVVVELFGPGFWEFDGPDDEDRDVMTNESLYSGTYDRRLVFDGGPVRRSGLSALWNGLVDFWENPVL